MQEDDRMPGWQLMLVEECYSKVRNELSNGRPKTLPPLKDVLGRSRFRTIARCRSVLYAALRVTLGWTWPEIAKAVGRDHSTVIQCAKKAMADESTAPVIERIRNG